MKTALGIEQIIAERIQESIAVKKELLSSDVFLALVGHIACVTAESLRKGGTVFFFGNGGSAGDAQHLAAELVGRYLRERPALRGVALTTNTSCLTAIGNDYGYDQVFARQLDALGSEGDIAIGISTSGSSKNVLRAVEVAKRKGMITIALTGKEGGALRSVVDYCLCISSDQTPRIQEAHIMIGHILCEVVEDNLFGRNEAS